MMRVLRSLLVTASAVMLTFGCTPQGGDPAEGEGGTGGTAGTAGMAGEGGAAGDGGSAAGTGEAGMGGDGEAGMGGDGEAGMGGGGEAGMGGGGEAGMGGGGEAGMGGSPPPGFCPMEITYVGQVVAGFQDMPEVPDGGEAVFEPYPAEYDSGLGAVIGMVPEMHQDVVDLSEMPMQITEATVIATNYYTDNFDVPPNQSRFWVADANGAIELFLDFMVEGATPEFQVRVGHKVSFQVTELGRYFDRGQISKATNFELVETDQPVYINDSGGPFTADQVHQLVRVTGILRNEDSCGNRGERCWDLMRAPDEDTSLGIFRSRSEFAEVGGCATYVGPLGWFNGTPQFDAINFTWHRIYD